MAIYKPSLLDKFKDFVNGLKSNWDQYEAHVADFEAHLAESMSEIISVTRDMTLTGVQTINVLGDMSRAKIIIIKASVSATKKYSDSFRSFDTMVRRCMYMEQSTGNWLRTDGADVAIADSTANRTLGSIANITNNSFELIWTHTGNGATGTANIEMLILYHGGV